MIAPSARKSRNAIVARAKNAGAGQASGYSEAFRRSPLPSARLASATAAKPSAPTAANRLGADAPKYKNAAPTPAPARPPMLKAAWKRGHDRRAPSPLDDARM